jgi:hypothetical protein
MMSYRDSLRQQQKVFYRLLIYDIYGELSIEFFQKM